jgi:plasmid stabilization system protein ParE
VRVEYSKRAVADLRHIAAFYARFSNPAVAERIAARIQEMVARLAELPLSGRAVAQRPGVRVVPLLRYRYKLFYRVSDEAIRILHIRHTSRRPYD